MRSSLSCAIAVLLKLAPRLSLQSLAHDRSELWPESSLPHKPPPLEENAASWEAIAFSGEPGDLLTAADEPQRVATGG